MTFLYPPHKCLKRRAIRVNLVLYLISQNSIGIILYVYMYKRLWDDAHKHEHVDSNFIMFFCFFFYFSSNALREYYVHLHCVWGVCVEIEQCVVTIKIRGGTR